MKSNYKILGNYIEKVEHRNINSNVTNLLGLSMTKEFRESTSNIIGTDLSVYKLIGKWHFACDFMSVIRVRKFPVVLQLGDEPTIVSPAYTVFKVKDSKILDPEYLMMWFRRSEFDRYAYFRCDGAVRGGFNWDELCESELPVPSIEVQREIVKEYHTIVNRIKLNEQLNQKLEETAQALYKRWFVDFEFPDKNGKPYKSNGGEMVWGEGLKREIPKGWEVKSFTKVVKLSGGGTPDTSQEKYWNGKTPFFTPADVAKSFYTIFTEKNITQSGLVNSSTKLYPINTVFVTARGTVGSISIAGCPMAMNQSCYAISGNNKLNQYFVHQLSIEVVNKVKSQALGAVFGALVTKDFDSQFVIEPLEDIVEKFGCKVKALYGLILNIENQNFQLNRLNNLVLTKMSKPEILETEQPA